MEDATPSFPWAVSPSLPQWRTSPNISYTTPPSTANALQTLNLYRPIRPSEATTRETEASRSSKPKVWAVFIHGGAWRDPLVTSASVEESLKHLIPSSNAEASQRSSTLRHLAGVASISYTLSPHPSHPNPSHDPSREGKHPQHLRDVVTALQWLHNNVFMDGDEYVLLGHSCGATLALQAVFAAATLLGTNERLHRPRTIVGISGLYDLPGLLNEPGKGYEALVPVYRDIVEGAFGLSENIWKRASPLNLKLELNEQESPQLIVLAHSPEDQLVSSVQRSKMVVALREMGWSDGREAEADRKRVALVQTTGKHNDVWEQGEGLADLLKKAIVSERI